MKLPPFDVFPTLRSETIILRQILPVDCERIVPISFYNGVAASSTHEAVTILERIETDYQNGTTVHWGIADTREGNVVGSCGYYRGFTNGIGELGCVLLPAYRGKGLMTEALAMAIAFGNDVLKLNKITAITTEENEKAIALLRRLGFAQMLKNENGGLTFAL